MPAERRANATKLMCLTLGLVLGCSPVWGRERKTLQKKSTAPADPQNRAADAWVDQGNSGTTHGGDATLQVSSSNSGNQRSLVEFDLSSLSNSGIKLATLSLFMTTAPSQNRTYQARRLTSYWKESDVTWASRFGTIGWAAAGGDNDGITTQSTTTGTTSNVTLSWDITAAVQQWFGAATPIANYGTEILDSAENSASARTAVFSSKDAPTEANRPSLTVEFVQNVTGFSAKAGNAKVQLNWSYPSSIGTVLSATTGVLIIRSTPGGAVSSTVVPTDGTVYSRNASCTNAISGITVVFVSSSMPTSFNDSAAGDNADCPPANGSVYTYKVFTMDANHNYSADGASSQYVPLLEANPSATVASQWATNWVAPTGVTNLAAPGISPGNVVVLPTNANIISGLNPTTGSAVFTPYSIAAGASGRPPVLDAADDSMGSPVSYSADANGFVYATNVSTGDLLWITNPTSNTANGYLGGAGVVVKSFAKAAYTRSTDLVVLGTNDTGTHTANQVMTLDGNTGATVWQYIGGGTNQSMDIVTSTPLVDYVNSTIWVTSHANGTTTQPSLWKFNMNAGGTQLLATANLNNVSNSPSLGYSGDVLFVGNDSGSFYAINTSINSIGAAPTATLATGDTQVIGAPLVYGISSPYTVILSTATKVRAVKYTTGSAIFTTSGTGTWTTPMPGSCTPSAPIGFNGLAKVYVGCSDGSVYQLDAALGTVDGSRSIRTGSTLGDSTMDTTLSILIFGSSNSRVYAVPFPF